MFGPQIPLMFKPNTRVMSTLKKAAQEHRTVKITYRDSKGIVTEREGEPYSIKNGGLYMYCHLRQSIRFFKLDSIQKARITNHTFIPRWPVEIA
jgi:predicted DNA-binding transcriptional regulator YafY